MGFGAGEMIGVVQRQMSARTGGGGEERVAEKAAAPPAKTRLPFPEQALPANHPMLKHDSQTSHSEDVAGLLSLPTGQLAYRHRIHGARTAVHHMPWATHSQRDTCSGSSGRT